MSESKTTLSNAEAIEQIAHELRGYYIGAMTKEEQKICRILVDTGKYERVKSYLRKV